MAPYRDFPERLGFQRGTRLSTEEEGLQLSPTLQILEAAEVGDVEKINSLLDADAQLANAAGEYGKTPLHWAAEHDHVAVAKVLLARGADVKRLTTWGATPLEWAGYLGSRGVADLLLSHGAKGMNLVIAAGLGMLERVKEYCEQNESLADLGIPKRRGDAENSKGWPAETARMQGDVLGEAFQVACRNGHVPVAEYLKERGASLEARGYFGGTGLHWAAACGHREMVDYLLDNGADPHAEDLAFKEKPMSWAAEAGHDDLALAIRDRMFA